MTSRRHVARAAQRAQQQPQPRATRVALPPSTTPPPLLYMCKKAPALTTMLVAENSTQCFWKPSLFLDPARPANACTCS
eukprot:354957-Chlamydomonas_euryale.AAC.4